MNLKRIIRLGNGGDLDLLQTNAAFLIEYTIDYKIRYILFNCGNNIPQKLIKNYKDIISKINYVFISHLNENSIGGLASFLQYRKKILKLENPLILINGKPIHDNFEAVNSKQLVYNYLELQNFNSKIITGINKKINPREIIRDMVPGDEIYEYINIIETDHRITESYGLLVHDKNRNAIFISGDTKANRHIKEKVLEYCYQNNLKLKYVFHDYSLWNNVNSNSHACNLDIAWEYGEELFGKDTEFIKYNDGKKRFQKEYIIKN